MNFHGHALDEADCFGLGAGLGFAYFESEAMSPTRMTATRNRYLEERFFTSIEVPFQWIIEPGPEKAEKELQKYLDNGIPVLLRADIAYLPHYNTSTHFPPHVIVAWGHGDNSVFIADTGWKELQKESWDDLSKARYGGNAYIKNRAEHFPVQGPLQLPDLKKAARHALAIQAKDLKEGSAGPPGIFGFAGMKTAVEKMEQWKASPDWKWCARWFYQVIEKRGTGGGAFRHLYSSFLENLQRLDPQLGRLAPPSGMKDIADKWTELAMILKEISEQEGPSSLKEASRALAAIREKEMDFFENLATRGDWC
jgi:hypothetical protein